MVFPLIVVGGCLVRYTPSFYSITSISSCTITVIGIPEDEPQRLQDFVHSAKSHVPMMFSSMLAFQVVATLCMCLRFYSKRVSKAKYFLDDYVLIASWVRADNPNGGNTNDGCIVSSRKRLTEHQITAIIYNFIALYMTRFGLGLDMGDFRSIEVLYQER